MIISWEDRTIEAPITAGDLKRAGEAAGFNLLEIDKLASSEMLTAACAVVWCILRRRGVDISLEAMMDESPLAQVVQWSNQFNSELSGDIEPPANPPTAAPNP